MDNFCIKCGEKIVKPHWLDSFATDKKPKAVEFKDGFMCGYCYNKMRREK
jgi:hypothetical protein